MDAERCEELVRRLLLGPSRRNLLVWLTSGPLAALPLALGSESTQSKKRKKKHKKKKKRTRCAPVCSGKACGPDGCGGSCGACGLEQTCQDGDCLCPIGLIKCGDVCIEGQQCCTDEECQGVTVCGAIKFCVCPNEGDILCSADACCESGIEVCPINRSNPHSGSCQAGGCPESDICNSETFFRCTPNCVCVTSVDDATFCTAGEADQCVPCSHDSECTTALGESAICIARGPFCGNFCPEEVTAFCVKTNCSDDALHRSWTRISWSRPGVLVDRR